MAVTGLPSERRLKSVHWVLDMIISRCLRSQNERRVLSVSWTLLLNISQLVTYNSINGAELSRLMFWFMVMQKLRHVLLFPRYELLILGLLQARYIGNFCDIGIPAVPIITESE